jgi:hypothetical protein
MLLGITPANKGKEVLSLLRMWKRKKLALGSSIVAEIIVSLSPFFCLMYVLS